MVEIDPPDAGREALRQVQARDATGWLALYREAQVAEDLVRRTLAELGLAEQVVDTVATLDRADRPVVCLTLTSTGVCSLGRHLRGGRPPPEHRRNVA